MTAFDFPALRRPEHQICGNKTGWTTFVNFVLLLLKSSNIRKLPEVYGSMWSRSRACLSSLIGWPEHHGNSHIRESRMLAPARPRMQAAGLQSLTTPDRGCFSRPENPRISRHEAFPKNSVTQGIDGAIPAPVQIQSTCTIRCVLKSSEDPTRPWTHIMRVNRGGFGAWRPGGEGKPWGLPFSTCLFYFKHIIWCSRGFPYRVRYFLIHSKGPLTNAPHYYYYDY